MNDPMTDLPSTLRQLVSTVTAEGRLELTLRERPMPKPAGGEVLIRVEAAPINPSDLAVMLSLADTEALAAIPGGAAAPIPEKVRRAVAGRAGISIPCGNEGAGTVVAAGEDAAAQALLGKRVALAGGGFYADYRLAKARECLVLPDDVTAAEGASSFINPMTALSMVSTMRRAGFSGIVHTAAASNLGQMMVKLCAEEGVPLVNIVRRPEQAALLRDLGAEYVCDQSAEDFVPALTKAIGTTQAFLGFDATGGGRLASHILSAMEAAALRTQPADGPYGSRQMKQVYLYGGLDPSPTQLGRGFGMKWAVGGWLLTYHLEEIGAEATRAMRARVAAGLKTVFSSHYSRTISLDEAVSPETVAAYNRRATGDKFLITPQA